MIYLKNYIVQGLFYFVTEAIQTHTPTIYIHSLYIYIPPLYPL